MGTGGSHRFGKLVLESERRLRDVGGLEEHPGEMFASRDTIQDLYEILDINNNHGLDFQSFFDLLQRVGEEKVSPPVHCSPKLSLTWKQKPEPVLNPITNNAPCAGRGEGENGGDREMRLSGWD